MYPSEASKSKLIFRKRHSGHQLQYLHSEIPVAMDTITLHNTDASNFITYNVRTTAVDRYIVSPATGTIAPGDCIDIEFAIDLHSCYMMHRHSDDQVCGDRFQIQVSALPQDDDESSESDKEGQYNTEQLENFWALIRKWNLSDIQSIHLSVDLSLVFNDSCATETKRDRGYKCNEHGNDVRRTRFTTRTRKLSLGTAMIGRASSSERKRSNVKKQKVNMFKDTMSRLFRKEGRLVSNRSDSASNAVG